MLLGIDCASVLNKTTATRARNAGFSFAGRYLVPASYSKALTYNEAKIISDAGLRILSVYETTASRATEGAAAGSYDGTIAANLAREIGMPTNAVIYFAVDFDAGSRNFPSIIEYFRAAKDAAAPYEIGA